jgi:5-hydroxyisourate hydrolase
VISTHVLDTAAGRPAAGVRVRLARADEPAAGVVETTDADGRARFAFDVRPGVHRLVFDTAHYFPDGFFPEISVTFTVTDPAKHHHVPILMSPFAFSTYRGS